jgi:hypothetical protein
VLTRLHHDPDAIFRVLSVAPSLIAMMEPAKSWGVDDSGLGLLLSSDWCGRMVLAITVFPDEVFLAKKSWARRAYRARGSV